MELGKVLKRRLRIAQTMVATLCGKYKSPTRPVEPHPHVAAVRKMSQ
jgi:hypothetical protein